MCRQADSIALLNDASDALTAACLKFCPDEIGRALKTAYDQILGEPVPAKMLDELDKLQ